MSMLVEGYSQWLKPQLFFHDFAIDRFAEPPDEPVSSKTNAQRKASERDKEMVSKKEEDNETTRHDASA